MDKPKKILILVEGEKLDVLLMKHLIQIYGLDIDYEIISYRTNVYELYNKMFRGVNPEDMDILQVLKERENNVDKKQIFNQRFTDILLIFDFEPQDSQFSKEKISKMVGYFVESTDMGKLYINYPMVEAFYHMNSIPDYAYSERIATLDELCDGAYKKRVNKENRNRDYRKFAVNREECNVVISQNIEKAWHILATSSSDILAMDSALGKQLLSKQLEILDEKRQIYVLCTCVFFIAEYNPKLLM